MKSRLLVAAVGIPFLLIVLLLLPKVVTVVMIAALAVIGCHELLKTTGIATNPGMLYCSMIMAAAVPFWCWSGSVLFDAAEKWILAGGILLFIYAVILYVIALLSYPEIRFSSLTGCLFGGIAIPLCLASISRIMMTEQGRYLVLIPILIPFIADAGAYFAGLTLGKHKMAPVLSPKKTIEGAIGGLLAGIIGVVLYCLVMQLAFKFEVNYLYAAIYGLLGSVISIIGDLSFSMVKRETGIKDYGTIFRAHGGVLDRFDSVIFAAPLIEILLLTIPVLH